MSEHKTTDALDTLRPEVWDTLDWIEAEYQEARTIRAELLRLENECGRLDRAWQSAFNQALENGQRAERAEAELAALKARIECADAGIVHRCAGCKATHVGASKDMIGKRILLLVDEPQGDNAKEGRSRE